MSRCRSLTNSKSTRVDETRSSTFQVTGHEGWLANHVLTRSPSCSSTALDLEPFLPQKKKTGRFFYQARQKLKLGESRLSCFERRTCSDDAVSASRPERNQRALQLHSGRRVWNILFDITSCRHFQIFDRVLLIPLALASRAPACRFCAFG
jgi:hypothetical protein